MKKVKKEQPLEEVALTETIGEEIATEQQETPAIEITETVEEVAPVVLKGNELRLEHGQCAVKRKDGRGGICLVMEKHFESKYSKNWIKLEIESKKK